MHNGTSATWTSYDYLKSLQGYILGICSVSGGIVTIYAVYVNETDELTHVFVDGEDYHTYYVASGVLVHNKCITKENGVRVDVRTSNEHGLPHAHVTGNGPNTTVGLDGNPMRGHPAFSKQQLRVIKKNWEIIKEGIMLWFK